LGGDLMAYTPDDLKADKSYVDSYAQPLNPLLTEAIWRVDAGAVKGDRLQDLSGNGRDAIFGAGNQAPVVLPWTGEDYVWFPQRSDSAGDALNLNTTGTWNTISVTIKGQIIPRDGQTGQFFQSAGASIRFVLTQSSTGVLSSNRYGSTTPTISLGSPPTKLWNRFTHTVSTGVMLWEHSDDGVIWTTVNSVNHGTCVAGDNRTATLGGGSSAQPCVGSRYLVEVTMDGVLTHRMRPSDRSADYTTIANTGSIGGNWGITRAATGYKLAIVDRPLLLFGGGQRVDIPGFRPPYNTDITCLIAFRNYSANADAVYLLMATSALSGGTAPGWALYKASATDILYVRVKDGTNNSQAVLASTSPRNNVLGGVITKTNISLFLDGVKRNTVTNTTTSLIPESDLCIGRLASSFTDFELLGVAIWDRALTDDEMAKATQELAATPDPHSQYLKESEYPSGPTGFRNIIRNGDMSIAQRGDGPFTATGSYTVDGWKQIFLGGTISSSRVPSVSDSSQLNITTSGQAAVTDYAAVVSYNEDVRTLNNKNITLSFSAKVSSGIANIRPYIIQSFGTGGSPSAQISTFFSAITLNTTLQRFTTNMLIPSIAGKTLGTNGNDFLAVGFYLSAGTSVIPSVGIQNNTFYITDVQLEEGLVATLFEKLPQQQQLAWCQRYFQRLQQPPLRGVCTNATNVGRIGMILPVVMRAAPTGVLTGTLPFVDGSANLTCTLGATYNKPHVIEYDAVASATVTTGRPCVVYQSGTSYIDLSAEL
jgi:hypothetical protein